MADPSPTLMGSLLFTSEAGRSAYHAAAEETEAGVQPFKQFDPRLYAVGDEPAGQKGMPGPDRAMDGLAGPVSGGTADEAVEEINGALSP